MGFKVDYVYTIKKQTPLKWHYFSLIIRAPLTIISNISDIAYIYSQSVLDELNFCIILMYLFSIVLLMLYFVGSFKWKRYAWKSIIAYQFYSPVLCFCIEALGTNDLLTTVLATLISIGLSYLQYVYYKKREPLFNNSKYDDLAYDSLEDYQYYNEFNNYTSYQAKFCRKCGTRLDDEALYCKKCGTRVKI